MKRITLNLFALSFLCAAHAQNSSESKYPQAPKHIYQTTNQKTSTPASVKGIQLWSDDFSDPSKWTMDNTSTPPIDWSIETDGTLIPVTALSPAAFTTVSNGYAFINSDAQGEAGIQNCNMTLTTPITTLGSSPNVSIVFQNSYRTYGDIRIVRVSNDGGTTWTDFNVTDGTEAFAVNTENPTMVNINISSAAGNQPSVLLQFNYQAAWGWYWAIDDIKIVETDDYDLNLQSSLWGVTGAYGAEMAYYQTPIAQIAPISFAGKAQNIGVMAQTDAELAVDIPSTSYSETSAQYTLDPGQVDTLVVSNAFTPASSVASYTANISIASGATEPDMTNNDLNPINFEITNYTYARDKGSKTGGIYNAGAMYEAGNLFDIFANASLYGVDIFVDDSSVIDAVFAGRIYEYDAAQTSVGGFVNIGETDFHTIIEADLGEKVTVYFNTPIALSAGKSYLVVAAAPGGAGDDLIIPTSGVSPANTSFYYDATTEATPEKWSYITGTPMVRMNFLNNAGIEENENVSKVNVYPNPVNTSTNVSFDLINESEVQITITDLAGKIVSVNDLGSLNAGNHIQTISTESLQSGIYMINFVSNNNHYTQKITVKK